MRKIIILTAVLSTLQFLTLTFAQTKQKPTLIVQTGHTDSVNAVAISPDGKIIASGSSDTTVKLWNVGSGQQLMTIKGHHDLVEAVAFSPDGKSLASRSYSDIKLWNSLTGQEFKSFEGETIAFSPDGKSFAFSNLGDVRLWEVGSEDDAQTLGSNTNSIKSIAFSPDGKMLASASCLDQNEEYDCLKGEIKFWNLETKEEVFSLEGHTDEIKSIAFSPDGKMLASGSCAETKDYACVKGDLIIWDLEAKKIIKSLTGLTESVKLIMFSPDGKILVSLQDSDETVKLWNIKTGSQINSLKGHTETVNSIAFSADGKTLISGSVDQTIKIWNSETGSQIKSIEGYATPVNSLALSPDGKTLALLGETDNIKIWNLEVGKQVKSIKRSEILKDIEQIVNISLLASKESAMFSPDGKTLATWNLYSDTVKLWNIESAKLIKSFKGNAPTAFSPDGKTLATGDYLNVKLWNSATGRLIRSLRGHNETVTSIIFSPDGKTLASIQDRGLRPPAIPTTTTLKDAYRKVSFSASNKQKNASFSDDEEDKSQIVRLWNAATGKLLKTFENSGSVASIAFSPNGKLLASGVYDTIELWNVKTGEQQESLSVENGSIESIAFSPNGKTFVSGSDDNNIKVWNVNNDEGNYSFEERFTFKGQAFSRNTVAFSPDGKLLFLGSSDGEVGIWNLEKNEFIGNLVSLEDNNWVVTTPDGFFDSGNLKNPKGLHWTMPDAPFVPILFETYMRDYYSPNLLSKVLKK